MNQYRDFDNYLKEYPSADGYFGKYGGNYLDDPELIKAFNEYAEAYNTIAQSAQFIAELRRIRRDFQGRPTPVYHCQNLSNLLGRTQIYLKREDLNHTGAHQLNHCMGEGLLAKFMGKKKLIAETGAGQLMGPGEVQVLALQVDLGPPQQVGEVLAVIDRCGSALEILADAAKLCDKLRRLCDRVIGFCIFVEGLDQLRILKIVPAKFSKIPVLGGIFLQIVVKIAIFVHVILPF